MKIRMTLKDTVITATLIDSKTTQDFISLLPLTLTLEDYGSTEKISYLPKRLSTEGAPAGIDPSVGDITYYALWGNMAHKRAGCASRWRMARWSLHRSSRRMIWSQACWRPPTCSVPVGSPPSPPG